ncbi:DoxX family protein [Paenibacillus sacheonensis]|uniref:DoxX family membrane protein n=1 Tax=Paenibacillus sacheonensis TaxID=742054 RepID=A0A7X4YQ76_9BACL|nr:DoxX family protein [Paenibacillus sacheonensis]MBM7566337.1 putative membrane protein YphA (DoxX/SURF4 family) [Paenibacillus sacheonensis]NBC70541.1 DoxX family membrane protein [Paenibacillus sacheonensis]
MDVLIWILQGLLAAMFVMAGLGKVSGAKAQKDTFEHLRLPQWFRGITGIVELAGAALLIAGYWNTDYTMAGALVIGVTAIGGTFAHLRARDGMKETFMIVLMGIIAFVIVGLI